MITLNITAIIILIFSNMYWQIKYYNANEKLLSSNMYWQIKYYNANEKLQEMIDKEARLNG